MSTSQSTITVAESFQRQMYGTTIENMKSGFALRGVDTPVRMAEAAMSIMSDSQELMVNGAYDQARQKMNVAKWLLAEQLEILDPR